MQGGERFYSVNDYLKKEFGRKMVKLSIDAGFTCPNRDGSKGTGGCLFCSEGGSGELASHTEYSKGRISGSLSEQIEKLSEKWPDAGYIAYFQAFTNTYAPAAVLKDLYFEALSDPRVSGIAIATRPDCISEEVLDLLEEINRDHFMWIELGLQSAHSETLRAMNTCYDVSDYDRTAARLRERGIRFVSHLILGLPGETREMMLASVSHVCDSGPFGIKLHLMNVVKNSALYQSMPGYVPFSSIEEYADLVISCLEIIPPDITIHRLTGDVPRKLLVSPEWSYRKRTILNRINKELRDRDTYQGAKLLP